MTRSTKAPASAMNPTPQCAAGNHSALAGYQQLVDGVVHLLCVDCTCDTFDPEKKARIHALLRSLPKRTPQRARPTNPNPKPCNQR